jgi:transposase
LKQATEQEPSTMKTTTIGIDLAKSVFQVHGVDAAGQVTARKKLRRAEVLKFFETLPPCLVGMAACATAHHWAREISALGHDVRLMPPSYVKAYVRRQKNDAADAEAICEAVTRPTMRFVPVKSAERQAVLVLHRARELLVRQRTMLINAIRGHCAEFGIIAPLKGMDLRRQGIELISQHCESRPSQIGQHRHLKLAHLLDELDRPSRALAWHRHSPASGSLPPRPWRRRSSIPRPSTPAASSPPSWVWSRARTPPAVKTGSGASPRRATATCASCWSLATSVIRRARTSTSPSASWIRALLERRPARVVTVAMANKTARIAWAVLARGDVYRAPTMA